MTTPPEPAAAPASPSPGVLTSDQDRLYQDVVGLAAWSGIDTTTILDGADATTSDKAAVADALDRLLGTTHHSEPASGQRAPADAHHDQDDDGDGWEL